MSTAYLCVLFFLCLGGAVIHAQDLTLLEVLHNQTRFSTYSGFLDASAALEARLGDRSVASTVFAPIDQKPSFNLTQAELNYTIADHRYLAANLSDGDLVPSLLQLTTLDNGYQQLKVSVTNGTVYINGVRVQQANIIASNGAVHALASVLPLPGPLTEALTAFPTLKSLLAVANITLPAGSTVFAPADAAFVGLQRTNPALFGYLTSGNNESHDDLGMVLKYHVLEEVLYAQNIRMGSEPKNTLAGQTVTLTRAVLNNTTEVTLNSSSSTAVVEAVNTLASDGVLHTINSVLVPNGFVFDLRKILIGLNDTTLLRLLAQANLTSCLTESCQYTIFAPTQEAWQRADESGYRSTSQLASVLKSHIYPHPLASLSQNMSLTMLSNKTVHILNNSLTLEGEAKLGAARLVGHVTEGANGYVYAIDQVLGVALASDDSLSKATIGWIIVGGMGGILLLAALIVAIVWYVKRKRTDYEVINGAV
jgi:uncharacterized surface protein with fasciclin (FAS1) repeats